MSADGHLCSSELALDLVGVECVLLSDEMVGALWTEEAFDAGGDAPTLGLVCWFWFFTVFWSTVCDGQHQNPSGVTAIGTVLNFVARASRLPTLNSAMLRRKLMTGEPWR